MHTVGTLRVAGVFFLRRLMVGMTPDPFLLSSSILLPQSHYPSSYGGTAARQEKHKRNNSERVSRDIGKLFCVSGILLTSTGVETSYALLSALLMHNVGDIRYIVAVFQ